MKKETTSFTIHGCEINQHFSHEREPNCIPQNVERMLLNIGLPQSAPNKETVEKSA